ncbi:MAG: RodZ domain-containing protein [Pseudomonadota bacterium]
MSDQVDSAEPAQDVVATPEPVGSWLSEAREGQNLSPDAVAQSLHLDVDIIEALEAEAFDDIGATVFVKGHLRAVAAHLGLDPDEAADRFHARTGLASDAVPELIIQYNRPIRSASRWPVVLGIAVAVVALAGALLFLGARFGSDLMTRQAPQTTGIESAAVPQANESANESMAATTFADRLAAAERASSDSVATNPEPVTDLSVAMDNLTQAVPSSTISDGLRMRFSAECWYEVVDANGTRLAYGTASSGLERRIDGPRPLSITVGVADAVQLSLDGKPVQITDAMRRGRAARLTLL